MTDHNDFLRTVGMDLPDVIEALEARGDALSLEAAKRLKDTTVLDTCREVRGRLTELNKTLEQALSWTEDAKGVADTGVMYYLERVENTVSNAIDEVEGARDLLTDLLD